MTHPKAKNPSYFFIFLINANGISKVPGTVLLKLYVCQNLKISSTFNKTISNVFIII